MCDALLKSGVLVGGGARRHPLDVEERDPLAERMRRMNLPSNEERRRHTGEHEASHAVTALALGMRVERVEIVEPGEGYTTYAINHATLVERATVALAGEIWVETFRSDEFSRGATGCGHDRRRAAGLCDPVGMRQAHALAHKILRAHRPDVLALADDLVAHGVIGPLDPD